MLCFNVTLDLVFYLNPSHLITHQMSQGLSATAGQLEWESLTARLKRPDTSDMKRTFGVRRKPEAACFKVLSTCDPLHTVLD